MKASRWLPLFTLALGFLIGAVEFYILTGKYGHGIAFLNRTFTISDNATEILAKARQQSEYSQKVLEEARALADSCKVVIPEYMERANELQNRLLKSN